MYLAFTATATLLNHEMLRPSDYRLSRFLQWRFSTLVLIATSAAALLSVLTWLGIESWNAWPIELTFEYRVPDEYPEKIATSGKGGRDPHVRYPREEYVYWFRAGFENCRDRFVWPEYPLATRLPLDPYDDDEGPGLKQYGGYERRADEDGFRACQLQLRDLSDRYGVARVRRAIRWKYGSLERIVFYYIWQNANLLRLVCGVSAGAACILTIVKIMNRRKQVSE